MYACDVLLRQSHDIIAIYIIYLEYGDTSDNITRSSPINSCKKMYYKIKVLANVLTHNLNYYLNIGNSLEVCTC